MIVDNTRQRLLSYTVMLQYRVVITFKYHREQKWQEQKSTEMATTKDTEREFSPPLLSCWANSVQPANSAVVHSPLAGACWLGILYSSNEIPEETDTGQVTH